MSIVTGLTQQGVPVMPACAALAVPRSSYYHARQERAPVTTPRRRLRSPRALSATERQQVRDMLNSERFVDSAPREVYAALLDDGEYLCGQRQLEIPIVFGKKKACSNRNVNRASVTVGQKERWRRKQPIRTMCGVMTLSTTQRQKAPGCGF